jgi:hypothetical protein
MRIDKKFWKDTYIPVETLKHSIKFYILNTDTEVQK